MDEIDEALELEVRNKIYGLLKESPGLHFREIQRRTGMATGSLQYHLDYLQRRHLVKQVKDTKFTRFYLIREGFEEEKEMSLLRQGSLRKIVLFLLTHKKGNNRQISKAIGLSPSTTSWHLNRLFSEGLVQKKKRGRKTFFSLVDPERVARLLVGYRKSFLDEMVDGFAEIWKEI
ncbi:MAG: winged helix-turn-helix transcriptional regulator [Candidatus Diapherotrites archaeon]|uniref:Winged helix-turn-helix transcriptional regulator n=1 Tax=Candidatus Iainarchaeum sp. TaxID=3101447 RepID=A0A7J4IRW9_9ARCH|nr:MAG: ArsR family transcriptional regulator [archaeon GW2011_AR10]MBS3059483.1 winged helix-turn-helix transcriptional regulator [Candidatus Diapherotrites archaeon]HIH08261.1 winged helix-turn-helix transcriptional regulator [Candidatus Diapherotrites archaeon]